jgi:hypothetical protein
MRPRSAIEMMIDQACGFDRASYTPPQQVTLRCPHCKRRKRVAKDSTDPEGTAIVEVPCDRCDDGNGFPEVHYFNSLGQWFDGERFVKPRK